MCAALNFQLSPALNLIAMNLWMNLVSPIKFVADSPITTAQDSPAQLSSILNLINVRFSFRLIPLIDS
ncbi:hypothetical protein HanRHA438_Chr05g0204551 [Helianthus annuus]|nr:hypothetical protein HanRHA438_Chr05g0204551 [Helianthus annuus]